MQALTWLSLAVVAAVLFGVLVVGPEIWRLGRRPVQSFQAAAERSGATTPAPIGLREIPVARVVGSVGRWRELAADFRPLRWRWNKSDDERFRGIEAALRRGRTLPPIVAYLLDGDYYVLDGHHRVAAARALGQIFIDADVIEYRRMAQLVLRSFDGGQPAHAAACGHDCLAAAA